MEKQKGQEAPEYQVVHLAFGLRGDHPQLPQQDSHCQQQEQGRYHIKGNQQVFHGESLFSELDFLPL